MSSEISSIPGQIKGLLDDLVTSSEAMIAILITREGTILGEAGATDSLNTTAAAALVAGMYSATREVARMVGENQFSILLQQGENRHVHISLVTDDSMLIIVFEDYQRIGLVRHEARKAGRNMADILKASRERRKTEEISMTEFKAYALNLVDRIFATK